MRARSLKPGFFKNELLGSADPLLGTLFQGLWCMADREGRLEDRPMRIAREVFPYRHRLGEKRIDAMLKWLDDNHFVTRYEISGARYIQVVEFAKHQSPHTHERPSEIPALRPNGAQPRNGASTTKDVHEHDHGTSEHPLTPSSLTPDSGLLTPDTPPTPPSGGSGGRVGRKGFPRKSAAELEAEARARGEDPWT